MGERGEQLFRFKSTFPERSYPLFTALFQRGRIRHRRDEEGTGGRGYQYPMLYTEAKYPPRLSSRFSPNFLRIRDRAMQDTIGVGWTNTPRGEAKPSGEFHDNSLNWDSDVSRWNSIDMAGVDINGEAIYTDKDIRYTRSKDGKTIYVIVLDLPTEGKIVAKMMSEILPYFKGEIKDVSLIGTNEKIEWKRDIYGLELSFPKNHPGKHAFCYKLKLE